MIRKSPLPFCMHLTAAQINVNEDNNEEQFSAEEAVDATLTQEDADTYLHRFQSFEPIEKLQELLDNCPEEENKFVQEKYNAFWGEVKGVLISPISWRDIRSYIDEGWVATSVVAGFFQLLKKQHDNNHRSILECEFGMLLNQTNRSNGDELQILRMLPVMSISKIMFPMLESNTHWFLIEVWVKERMIYVYDSLRHHHEEFIKILVGFLEEAGKSAFAGDWDKWETNYTTDDYIRQVDEHSSGVLTSYYAWRLSNNRTLDYWNSEDKVATGIATKQLHQDLMTSIISGKAKLKNMKSVMNKKQKIKGEKK